MHETSYIKKSFILALAIEVFLASIWIWLSLSEGHSGFTAGGLLQFPGAILGIIIAEKVRDMGEYFSIILCFIVTLICQLIILTILIQFIFKIKNRSKSEKLNST